MKTNKLGASHNFFPSSKSKKYKDKYKINQKSTSTKSVVPLHLSLMQLRRGPKRKITTENELRKKTNRIYKLHKRDKNRKALQLIKKELEQKILGKYANPYMKNITHMISPFSKEKKILYYDYYQITYILDKKRCDLYSRYKDFKLIYDNQEYFFKFFSQKESKVYLTYLLYVTYSKDSFVKSKRAICLTKNIDRVKEDYKEHIIKNVFNAKRLILSRDLNKYLPDLSPKIYEKAKEKLSRIEIPKYKLNVKPVISKKLKYIYIKDVPIIKIPKIIPNYSKQDKGLYSIIKSLVVKKKYSILLINGKRVPKDNKNKKDLSKELSKDNNILYSLKGEDSDEDDYTLNNSSLLYISRFYTNFNFINKNFRNKKNKDINDIESLIYRIKLNTEEKKSENNDTEKNILPSNLDSSLNTIKENDSEVFLSTLKQPFIGNRQGKGLKHVKFKGSQRSEESDNKERDNQLLLYTLEFLSEDNRNEENKKFKLFLDLNEDEYNFKKDKEKEKQRLSKDKQNIIKNYFNERFIDPEKYKEYLIKSPFIKTVYNISDSFYHQNKSNNNKIYPLLNNNLTENKKSNYSLSFNKNKKKSFKATYEFLLGQNKKEKRDELINHLVNKSNKIYSQIKTISEMEKTRNNFKKSGRFAFTSFNPINLGPGENEWDINENYFRAYHENTFRNSNLMKKINRENFKKDEYFKKSTTFNQILKSSNIYL